MKFSPKDAIKFCLDIHDLANNNHTEIYVDVNSHSTLSFPGYKKRGDYALSSGFFSKNGVVEKPSHVDVLTYLHQNSTTVNYNEVIDILESIYSNGLQTYFNTNHASFFDKRLQDIVFWASLQEEINYPQPKFEGKSMAMSRYFEGVLSALPNPPLTLSQVCSRTNNHGRTRPNKTKIKNYITSNGLKSPSFY